MALIGRTSEASMIDAALSDAFDGRGATLLLPGEPGVGKSALVEDAAERAAERGALCAWGRAWEAGGAPAFWPWVEVLRTLLDAHFEDDLRKWLGHGVADVAALVPELADRLVLPASAPLAPGAERFRLFDAVAGFLVRSSQARPVVVLLEDLHVADASSLLLLAFVAPRLARSRAVVVGTYRDVGTRREADVEALLAKIGRSARTIPVRALPRPAVAELVAAAGLPAELADRVYATTEGNALFVRELLRMLRARADHGETPGSAPIPDGVRGAIRDHLAPLGADVRALLEVGAVVGRDFGLELVAAVAGVPARAAAALADEAQRHGVISDAGLGRYRFSHVLVRDVLYDDTALARRTDLHVALADALETAPDPPLAEVARHLASAGVGLLSRAVDAWVRASRRAAEKLAFEDAVTLLENGLSALEAASPGDEGRRFELILELGALRLRAGSTERGLEACLEAVRLARELGSPTHFARAALAYGDRLILARRDPVLISLLTEVLERLPPGDGALRARVMARLSAAEMPCDEIEIPSRRALEAVDMARRLGDRDTLLAVLNAASSALSDFAGPAAHAAINDELLALATELGDQPVALRAHMRLVFDRLELGELGVADDHIRAYDHLAAEFRQPHVQWQTYLFRSIRPLMEGRFDESVELLGTARVVAERAGDPNAHISLLFHQWQIAKTRGSRRDLKQLADRMLRIFDSLGTGLASALGAVFLAGVHAQIGNTEEARRTLDSQRKRLSIFISEVITLAYAADAWALVGDAESAAWALDAAPPRHAPSNFVVSGATGFACEGPIGRTFMKLAITCGRFDEAERYFTEARAVATAVRARPCLTHMELEWANALVGRDDARAAEHASSAASRAKELGMDEVAERADALVARLGRPAVTAAVTAAPPSPSGLDRTQEAKLASLADLVAGIAHEINNPLGALQSTTDVARRALDVLRQALDDPEMAAVAAKNPRLGRALEALQKTQDVAPEATGRIARVVTELRHFARLDQADVDRVDLRDSLDTTVAMLGRDLDGRIDVVRRYEALPPVLCRPRELHEALLHLLRNAVQAIEDRGTVTVSLARANGDAVVEVEDTGSGIPPEILPRIFDPGFTTRGVGVGIGIGLAIVHRVAHEHGGTVSVDSHPGRGSRFTLRLPIDTAA